MPYHDRHRHTNQMCSLQPADTNSSNSDRITLLLLLLRRTVMMLILPTSP
jgi:hypothetical protein